MTFKLGRKRPVARGPRFRLTNYLKISLPAPPTTCDYTAQATASLSSIYKNDVLGCCVIAGAAHVDGVMTGNAGDLVTFTDDQIIALYSAIGGYDPSQTQPDGSNPTDQGCDEETALNYWQNNGLLPDGSHKIQGWMAIDGNNPIEVRTALWLFENIYFGVELPDGWVNPFPSAPGFTWDVVGDPDPSNGHCFIGAGYDTLGVAICTWGMLGKITDAAIAKYATSTGSGELYTVISQDGLNVATQKCPAGVDWSQLMADFDSMKA